MRLDILSRQCFSRCCVVVVTRTKIVRTKCPITHTLLQKLPGLGLSSLLLGHKWLSRNEKEARPSSPIINRPNLAKPLLPPIDDVISVQPLMVMDLMQTIMRDNFITKYVRLGTVL